jgi:hypothetical protein
MQLAESLDVPWLAWSFSEQNDPSMLLPATLPAGHGSYGCHVTPDTQIALEPNAWGGSCRRRGAPDEPGPLLQRTSKLQSAAGG